MAEKSRSTITETKREDEGRVLKAQKLGQRNRKRVRERNESTETRRLRKKK